MLIESGWGVPHWPQEWHGRGLPVGMTPVVEEEFDRLGAVGVAKMGIRTLAAATILEHGTDLHKQRFLRGILTGEETWCQLFSEPGSGSDLAGAVTRADFRDGKWVINGQKVWNTSAHHADFGLLLARTDWDAVKHQGLSYFLLDMRQPGVRGPPAQADERPRLLQPGLLHRRRGGAGIPDRRARRRLEGRDDHPDARAAGRGRRAPLRHRQRPAGTHLRGGARRGRDRHGALCLVSAAHRPRRPADRAREGGGALGRPGGKTGGREGADARPDRRVDRTARPRGAAAGPAAGAGGVHRQARRQHRRARLRERAHHDRRPRRHADWERTTARTAWWPKSWSPLPAISIAGGTDEIQRNIISERILSMPKEARHDTDRPFREVPRNQVG